MRTRALRLAAAYTVAIIMAAPFARLLCAYECRPVVEPVTSSASEHCHKSETTDRPTVDANAVSDCTPFALSSIAARDRAAAPFGAAPLPTPLLRVLDVHLAASPASAVPVPAPAGGGGLPPGARLPLRI